MQFTLDIEGDRRVDVRLEQFPERARAGLARRIDALAGELLARVLAAEPKRTGKLASETGKSGVRCGRDFVSESVRVAAKDGAEARKAGALEYGASKPAAVPSHTMRLTHVFARQIAPLDVVVAAYKRPMNMAARHYLRGPLDSMRGEIRDALHEAIEEALS
jgi:hypothetical protein